MPMLVKNGPTFDISSCCLNQFGFNGGQVPSESIFIEGQSMLSLRGLIPVVFLIRSFSYVEKYQISKIFSIKNLSANISTFLFCSAEISSFNAAYCFAFISFAIFSHSYSNFKHSSSYFKPQGSFISFYAATYVQNPFEITERRSL